MSAVTLHHSAFRDTYGRLKNRYWFKTLKWYLYKWHSASDEWRTSYTFDQFARKLQPSDLVIDCGANLGAITRQMARWGATVHAFEPDPWTFSHLQAGVADLPNVVCHQAAVGVGNGTVRLYRTADFDGNPAAASISSSTRPDKANISSSHYVDVPQVDLVEFLQGLPRRVRILKMDIEGAEIEVLESLIETGGMDCIDKIFVETHEDRIPALVDRTRRLRELAAGRLSGRLYLDWH